jgi:hypothetical protein
MQLSSKWLKKNGSSGRIRTYKPSVNSCKERIPTHDCLCLSALWNQHYGPFVGLRERC